MAEKETLNIHQKILKLVVMAGVLQKNKAGFNYKYVTEDEIQAKVTAGMKQYNLMLYPSITPGTLHVTPVHYMKWDKKANKGNGGEVPVNEVIAYAEMSYRWVNCDNPEEYIDVPWALIGQMEDAAQAFGAGLTYANRYFLLKSLQIATVESDPDNYRSKQKAAEAYEAEEAAKAAAEALEGIVGEVVQAGSKLIAAGYTRDDVMGVVGKYNDGNQNPNEIETLEVANAVMTEFEKMLKTKPGKKTAKKTNEETTD